MGRTNPTFRDFLDRYEDRFGDYRRALRYEHQEDFDRLFQRARAHADAAGYANHLDRDRLVLLSMILGQERAIRDLEAEIEALRQELAEQRDRPDGDADRERGQSGATSDRGERVVDERQ